MTIELWMLIGSTVLLFVLTMGQQLQLDLTLGAKYALSNRTEPKTIDGIAGRIDRAIMNLRENLLLFGPVVLVLAVAGISTGLSQTGAIVFFIARIIHAITYIAGVILIRSLAWFTGIIGIGMMLSSLFAGQ
ncbi:MAPEG family protein [filamentous cyanobacterium LEGE 11480]|uniref:MAPEG family protein n=1 Tax=Romeriopsis navalis LEGE 11480 TaxID=2777977 RepID=A0A928Z3C3_9CYAN|nr:MAPEG family protein [Romeriopsis navalis]MBE9029165.1 MAPEG family protein [Romeriopsis navalis LEGE 11480]